MSVKGVIIAGRISQTRIEFLQKQLRNPIYPNIEFLTTDDLSNSLLEITDYQLQSQFQHSTKPFDVEAIVKKELEHKVSQLFESTSRSDTENRK